MLRAVIYTLLGILVITFLRGVIGLLTKGVGDLFREEAASKQQAQAAKQGFGGELVKDPVCGTFVSVHSKHRKILNGNTFCYCSPACKDKHTIA